jgi:hypothetical protein
MQTGPDFVRALPKNRHRIREHPAILTVCQARPRQPSYVAEVSHRSLAVTLVVSSGPIGGPPRMDMALTLAGVRFADRLRASGTVVERGSDFVDFVPGDAEFSVLCDLAVKAGFAERTPLVDAVVDTGDYARLLVLHVSHEGGGCTLELSLMSSGFAGPDADALRRFLAALFDCAGTSGGMERRDLRGSH